MKSNKLVIVLLIALIAIIGVTTTLVLINIGKNRQAVQSVANSTGVPDATISETSELVTEDGATMEEEKEAQQIWLERHAIPVTAIRLSADSTWELNSEVLGRLTLNMETNLLEDHNGVGYFICYSDMQELSGDVLVLTEEDAVYYNYFLVNEEFHLAINENYVQPELFPEYQPYDDQPYAVGEAITGVFDPTDIIEYRVEDGYYDIEDPRYIITYNGQEHNMAAEDSFYSIGREDYEYEGIDNSDGIDALIGQFIENFGDPIIGIDENEDVTEYSWYIGPKKENILKLEYITTENYGWYLTSFNTNTPH